VNVKGSGDVGNGFAFQNKPLSQLLLIWTEFSRTTELDPSFSSGFAACACSLSDQVSLKLRVMQFSAKCREFLAQRRGARRLESIRRVVAAAVGLKIDWTKPLPRA
jgi:hypothetical protein